jgi:ribosomal protein L23
MKTLSLIPHISEKAYQMSIFGTYIFDVPTDANKAEIARLVESKYEVSVITVNVLNRKGKKARSIRLGSKTQPIYGLAPELRRHTLSLRKVRLSKLKHLARSKLRLIRWMNSKKEKKLSKLKKSLKNSHGS